MNRFKAHTIAVIAAVSLGILTQCAFGQLDPNGPSGQTAPPTANLQNTKAQAAQFVQYGREALKSGNAQQAAHWANQAKTLNAVFGPGEDSPEQLLMDIQSTSGLQAAPVAPAVGATAVNMNPADPKAVGRRNLCIIKARLALAEGDVARATTFANEAGAMNIPYNANDDTHENVLKHIQNFSDTLAKLKAEGKTESVRRLMAKSLIEQAQTLLGWGKLDEAASLSIAAQQLDVQYNQYEVQPKDLLARIDNARTQKAGKAPTPPAEPSVPAPNTQIAQNAPLTPPAESPAPVADPQLQQVTNTELPGIPTAQSAAYNSATDTTQNIQVAAETPSNQTSIGYSLLQQAQAALQMGNREQARQIVMQAEQYRSELDPASANRLTEMQAMLSGVDPNAALPAAQNPTPAAAPNGDQTALFGQMVTEFENTVQKTRSMRQEDPKAALDTLKEYQKKVEGAPLADAQKEMLLRNVKSKVAEMEGYIRDNQAEIDLNVSNAKSREKLQARDDYYNEREAKLKEMSDQFNSLIRENRYAEAEVLGKRAVELYPDSSFAQQMATMGKMWNRKHLNEKIRAEKEDGVVKSFLDVDKASVPQTEDLVYGEDWNEITNKRAKYKKQETRYSEKELEIQKRLSTPIQARYTNQPLASVMDELAQMAGVTIHLAPDGLAEQSVQPSQPVTLNIQDTIPLKSALNLILEPLNLDYTIRNDVLMITSKSKKDTDTYTVTYPVADLVIPIPNFQPSSNMGLEGALRSAMGTANANSAPWMSAMANAASQPQVVSAQNVNAPADAAMAPGGMGQVSVPMGGAGGPSAVVGGGASGGFGSPAAGNAGGASQEDFDKLIDLIKTTVSPETWDDGGGTGTISSFNVNLSLVVSQTQEVHEQIANLLEQLRRLQDLQITIECRFITLSDSFYERIGVDFNVNFKSNNASAFTGTGGASHSTTNGIPTSYHESAKATSDYYGTNLSSADIKLNQGSSALALPMYGNFNMSDNAGATMGFSILSDVEAYLFLEASQSTERSNILQAPKVTLFNGQQALVQDVTDTPFVVSVIPVVGDFAAALQPVIVVLSEGTFMTVQAVASPDRRYVRLTVVPFFSQIGDVTQFTFTGSTSSSRDTSSDDENNEKKSSTSGSTTGTTVQLPEYSYVTVTTTVSVPDGGTILLGGIKRLSEGRNEKGVPILNKIPFINR
ncbi:MAG: hypothetical protein IJU53_00810, partial [Thermoguttaceae bacterium]|nr:hypothetical protein [Thermoguttaceae bacterium]